MKSVLSYNGQIGQILKKIELLITIMPSKHQIEAPMEILRTPQLWLYPTMAIESLLELGSMLQTLPVGTTTLFALLLSTMTSNITNY